MQLSERVWLVASGAAGCSLSHRCDCNAYAVRCGDQWVLIDSGVGADNASLIRRLNEIGARPPLIDALLLTHAHLDHAGGAAVLHHELGLTVAASEEAAAALENADEAAISLTAARAFGIYPADFKLSACRVARKLRGGETWAVGDSTVRVVRTPGHSRDMVTYLLETPAGLLAFPGDTVFHGGRVLISSVWDCNPAVYAESLRALAALPVDGLFPGHGIWSLRDGCEQIRAAIPFLDRMLLPPNLF